MNLEQQIAKVRNLHDFENLKERLGKELGQAIYNLIDMSEKADKELTIVHNCLTDLYNYDVNVKRIKETLDDVQSLSAACR